MHSYEVMVYKKNEKVAKIEVKGTEVKTTNYIDNVLWLPFGVQDVNTVTYKDLLEFYEDR